MYVYWKEAANWNDNIAGRMKTVVKTRDIRAKGRFRPNPYNEIEIEIEVENVRKRPSKTSCEVP